MVEFKLKNGAGCDWSHYLPAEMEGKIVPDEHIHEHATCFNLKDKGLIVISSCGHVGIVNSVRQAMEVSGVSKVHAIMGGFHLGPAPADYLTQVVAEIGKLNPDVLIPMHCSGLNFTQEAQRQMPGKVLATTTGHPHHFRHLTPLFSLGMISLGKTATHFSGSCSGQSHAGFKCVRCL